LVFLPGGQLQPDSGVNIAISTDITAQPNQIFAGLGTISLSAYSAFFEPLKRLQVDLKRSARSSASRH
jgi:hypothetical protein